MADEDTNKTPSMDSPSQWMKDVNESLGNLEYDYDVLKKKVQTNFLITAVLGGLAGIEALGIATLFKTQKAIIDTLGQISQAIQPPPIDPREEARAREVMMQPMPTRCPLCNVAGGQHAVGCPYGPTTEVKSDVAPPAQTPATESSEATRAAMAADPDWEILNPDLTNDGHDEVNPGAL